MSLAVGPLVDKILRRVRDEHGTAHSRELVRRLLNYAEGWVGIVEQCNLETFSFVTDPLRCVYNVKDINSDQRIVAIQAILVNGRELIKMSFGMLGGTNARWFRDVGADHLTWSPVGRDLFVLYPATQMAQTLSIVALSHVPYPYANDSATTTIEDHRTDEMLDLTEALMYLRLRRLDLLKPTLARLREGAVGELTTDPRKT